MKEQDLLIVLTILDKCSLKGNENATLLEKYNEWCISRSIGISVKLLKNLKEEEYIKFKIIKDETREGDEEVGLDDSDILELEITKKGINKADSFINWEKLKINFMRVGAVVEKDVVLCANISTIISVVAPILTK